jgi:hypothetical protein
MPNAPSSALLFGTDELAQRFVRQATLRYGVPCLRYDNLVYVVAEDEHQMRQVLSIGRELGATDPQ